MTTSVRSTTVPMQVGDHYCGIYRTDEEQRAVLIDFVRQGVVNGEKMVYIVNIQTAAHLKATLAAAGIDVEPLLARGQLVILTAKDAYLRDGEFDPDKMIALLGEETDRALAEGYAALRATGEMTWALAGEPGSERLVEYESKLNDFIRTSKCYGYCQYDRRRFDAEMLLEVVQTHPQVLYGQDAFDNTRMYYVPPEEFLTASRPAGVLARWLENLADDRRRLG